MFLLKIGMVAILLMLPAPIIYFLSLFTWRLQMNSIKIGTVVSEKTSFKMLPDYTKLTFDE